jgi:hypothetical protein
MKRLFRRRPSPAMVVALVALFVSLAGVSYGAATIGSGAIINNSIRSKDVRNNSLTTKDIRNSTIRGKDVRNNTLTNSDIKNSDLLANNSNALGGIAPSGFLRSTNEGGGALAGVNVTSTGAVSAFFNRFGGTPTVTHTANSGVYLITFPGLEGKLLNSQVIQVATLFSSAGEIRATSSGSNPQVRTFTSAGAASDRSFYYVVYGSNLAP